MDLVELHHLVQQINENERVAIIALIDAKTGENMTNVVSKLDSLGEALKAQIAAVDAKVNTMGETLKAQVAVMDAKIEALDTKIDVKFDSIEKRISLLQWCVLAGFSAIGLLITLTKLV